MKRCPQCQFIYVDADEICDFDGMPLSTVSDSELNLSPRTRRSGLWLTRVVAAIAAIVAGLVVIFAYHQSRQTNREPIAQQVPTETPTPSNSPTPNEAGSALSPTPETKEPESSTRKAVTIPPTVVSKDPVSTAGKIERGAATIWLQSGGRIDVDEVWRTKQGIWYRRQGVVTLIKSSSVKAIQKR